MNLDWIKRNAVIVILLTVFLLLFGYEVVQLHRAYSRRKAVETELEQETRRLNDLVRAPVFPSAENLKILQNDHQQLDGLHQKLVLAAARPVDVPEKSRVQFRALLTEKLNSLTDHAEEKNITLPAGFAFGFDEYLGIIPPDNEPVLRTLTKQLLVVEKLCETLYASDIKILTKVGREGVASAEDTPKSQSQYTTSPFDLSFTCETKSLDQFLNGLIKLDWFFAVRTLEVKSVKISLGAGNATALRQPSSDEFHFSQNPRPPGARQPAAPKPVEQSLLEVTMRVDLVEINPGAQQR